MTNEPLVRLPESPETRERLDRLLRDLDRVSRDVAFRTQSATKARLCLTGLDGVSMNEVVVRNAGIGSIAGPRNPPGISIIHRRSGRKVMTWEDLSVPASAHSPLTRRRTMHDHRPTIERWMRLWEVGEARNEPGTLPDTVRDALDFCARHVAACMSASGEEGLHTVHLRLAAGPMPLKVKIATVKTHMNWRFVVDDLPELSQALADRLRPTLPEGWSFSVMDTGDTTIAPLEAGYRIVAATAPSETLRVLADPAHAGLPQEIPAR